MRFVFADYRKVTIHNSFFFLAIVTVNVCPPIFSARIFLLHRLLEVWSTFNIQQCFVCVWSAGTLNWYIFKTKYFYLNILVGLCPSKAYCSLASNEFFLSILMPLETFFYVSHLMLPVQCQWFCAKFHFSCSVPGHCTFFFIFHHLYNISNDFIFAIRLLLRDRRRRRRHWRRWMLSLLKTMLLFFILRSCE